MTKGVKIMEDFYVKILGFQVLARYGYVNEEHTRFTPEVSWEELESKGARLRLVELQCGAVNLVLMPSKFQQTKLDHFGIILDEQTFENVFQVAEELDLKSSRSPERSFIATPFGFKIELHPNVQDRYAFSEEDFHQIRITEISLGSQAADQLSHLLSKLLNVDLDQSENAWILHSNQYEIRCIRSESLLQNIQMRCSPNYFSIIESKLGLKAINDALQFQDPFGTPFSISRQGQKSPGGRITTEMLR
jgi:hypothetical protein